MYYNFYFDYEDFHYYIFDDKRGIIKKKYQSYCYKRTENETDFRSIYGDKVEPVRLNKDLKTDPNCFEVDVNAEIRVLVDKYYETDEIAKNKIMFLDIEISSKGGFADKTRANKEILSICTYTNGVFVTFVYDKNGKFSKKSDDDKKYVICHSETELLEKFLLFFKKINPTIISGWYSWTFDIPYLYKRICKILDSDRGNSLSPIGSVRDKIIGLNHRNEFFEGVQIAGINHLDYLILYKKYSLNDRSSFSLENICTDELGEGKVLYDGSLDELYETNIEKFIEYNIKDVELLVKLEDKLKYLQIAIATCHKAHVSYENVFQQSKVIEGIIFTYFKKNNLVSTNKTDFHGEQIRGAFVKHIEPKLYDWVATLDLISLYPSIIRTLNISPETKIGKVENYEQYNEFSEFTIKFRNDSSIKVSKDALNDLIKRKKFTISSSGVLYSTNKKGFLNCIVEELFNERIEFKKLQKKYKAEDNNKISEQYNIKQYVTKILLNSIYGVISMNNFRFYDRDNGESITITGQNIIQTAMSNIEKIIETKVGKIGNYVIGGDTDSLMFTLKDIYEKDNDESLENIVNYVGELTRIINDDMRKFTKNKLNSLNCHIIFNQEVIAETVLWSAKKRYAMKVVAEEGVILKKSKLKIKGLDVVKSDFPKSMKKILNRFIIDVLDKKDAEEIKKYVVDYKKEMAEIPITELAIPKGVKDIEKQLHKNGSILKGCPIHVRAAINYNNFLKRYNLEDKCEKIISGDKIKYLQLTNNPLEFPVIAFKNDRIPEEMKYFIEKYIDYNAIFNSTLKNKLSAFYSLLGWEELILTENNLGKFF